MVKSEVAEQSRELHSGRDTQAGVYRGQGLAEGWLKAFGTPMPGSEHKAFKSLCLTFRIHNPETIVAPTVSGYCKDQIS